MSIQVEAKRRGGTQYYVVTRTGSKAKFVGVTTVLGEVAKPQLMGWAAKVAAQAVFDDPDISLDEAKKAHLAVRDAAGNRGSAVHSYAEAWANGAPLDPDEAPETIRGYVQAVDAFFKESGMTILHPEAVVVSETYEYAGTADGIGEDAEGNTVLLDYKTSSRVYDYEMGLQLRAYERADYLVDPKTREPIDLPEIDYAMIVHLKPSGRYSLHKLDGDFGTFLAYLHAYRVRNDLTCPPTCPWENA